MKNLSLLITAACALSAASAPQFALADDDGLDCGKEPAIAISQAVIDFMANKKNAEQLGCAEINVAFVSLVGNLEPTACNGSESYCRDGKHFVQKYEARDADGYPMEGHVAVDWHYTRAGFTEWCQETVLDCKMKPQQ